MICLYLHLAFFYGINVGKYTSPMDPMVNNVHVLLFVYVIV